MSGVDDVASSICISKARVSEGGFRSPRASTIEVHSLLESDTEVLVKSGPVLMASIPRPWLEISRYDVGLVRSEVSKPCDDCHSVDVPVVQSSIDLDGCACELRRYASVDTIWTVQIGEVLQTCGG